MDVINATKEPEPPVLSSSPSLSPDLLTLYNSLDSFNRGVFIKVFRSCYHDVIRKQAYFKRGASLYYWYMVDWSRLQSGLTASELAVLTYLYQHSKEGTLMVHSDQVYSYKFVMSEHTMPSKVNVLHDLKQAGYITRHTRNPGISSHLRCSHTKQAVFIKLTLKGVQCVEGIEKDIYKILLNTSLDDITGVNKKP